MRVLLALLAVLLAACTAAAAGDPSTAAVVGDAEIPISELEDRFEEAAASQELAAQLQQDADGQLRAQVQAQILTSLIQLEILEQWAADLGVEATEQEVEAEREEVVEQLGGQEAFDAAVEQNNLTPEQVDETLRQRVLQDEIAAEVAGDPVSEADIEAFYQENLQTQFAGTATARHILVEDEATARRVLRRLQQGEDFGKLAREFSTDTGSGQQGGRLPPFSPGQTAPAFDEALFNAPVGELVGPVQTEFGFHLIEVLERSGPTPLDEVREQIRAQLEEQRQGEALQSELMERTRQADVVVNPRFGEFDPETGEVRPVSPLGETTEAPDAAGNQQPLAPGGAPAPTEVPTP